MSHRFADPCTGFTYRIWCQKQGRGRSILQGGQIVQTLLFQPPEKEKLISFPMVGGTENADFAHSSQRNIS
jgi:hypothetical protein